MENLGYDNIDDYLLGRLDGEALKEFEQRLQKDKYFAKKVAEQKQAVNLLEKISDLKIKQEIQETQKKYKSEKNTNSLIRTIRPWIMVAACLLFLLTAFWMFDNKSNEELFNAYYSAYDTSFGDRSDNNPETIKLAEASQFYTQKEYEKALAIFESITTIEDGKIQLATGISHLEIGSYEQAIKTFNQLIIEKDPVYQYHGIWYSAMTYLKSGDIENCKVQLQKLIDIQVSNDVYNQTEAKALLKKL